ncbi:MAG: PD40 domain-containing protein [Bacteroidales bacterium]|nr:PD40 domain-containing protein [Bacteroidales bacterium]
MSAVFGTQVASAQDSKLLQAAEEAAYNNDWTAASNNYKQLVGNNPENANYHSQLGYCYRNLGEKQQAIAEFRKANSLYSEKEKNKVAGQTNQIALARTLREADSIDQALSVLEALESKVNGSLKKAVENEIESCKFAQSQKSNPKDNMVLNLGAFVNGDKVDHSPVLSNNQRELFFTSRRELEGHSTVSENMVDENVYKCTIVDSTNTWSKPSAISGEINTSAHDAVVAISPDGNELYIYREDDNGSLLVSRKSGSSWSAPELLGGNINTPYEEKGAALSPDGNKLYFASDRPGSKGGLDIFVATRQDNGAWGNVKNLGDGVNTEADEEGPFVSGDNTKLYFSSKGHAGIGGYDLFSAPINGDNVGSADNLGAPINTNADELYVFEAGKKIYFSSNRGNGMGNYDLYVAGPTALMATPETVVNGKVKNCKGDMPKTNITVRDNSTGKSQEITPAANGDYSFTTNRGHNYTLTVTANSSVVYNEIFDIATNEAANKTYPTIQLDPQNDCNELVADNNTPAPDAIDRKRYDDEGDGTLYDRYIEIEDVLFEYGKADALTNNPKLNELAEYLKQFPKAKVMVKGYADSKSSAPAVNAKLGLRRANQGKQYLLNKGVKASQIVVKSFGEENPVALNILNGQYNNDCARYNRRLEFKMIEQGETTMLIRGIRNIPSHLKSPDYKRDYNKASGWPETTK